MSSFERGIIYWVNLDPTVGSEIKKKRPCVLIGATPVNIARRTIIVVPLSSSAKSLPPLTVEVNALGKKVVAVCDQIRAVDKFRLVKEAGKLNSSDLEKVVESVKEIIS
ncbi:MAG: type II toxin-antitoxin system PemK/MazF family toxin [Candidatus Bathyarchaeia archaeon]